MSFHFIIHGAWWVIFTTPAQFLYETGGTFADGFWEVGLIDATNGCSENRHRVRAAEWEPGEESVSLSPSLQSTTGERSLKSRAAQNCKYLPATQELKHENAQ